MLSNLSFLRGDASGDAVDLSCIYLTAEMSHRSTIWWPLCIYWLAKDLSQSLIHNKSF